MLGSVVASRGVHPITQKRLSSALHCQQLQSLCLACGADWAAGTAQFRIGCPVKCARNGVCLLMVPDMMSVCVVSPVLHLYQNSLSGMALLMKFSDVFGLHRFGTSSWDLTGSSWDVRKYWGADRHTHGSKVLDAACNGDIVCLQDYRSRGVDLDYADYDKRTCLHLAAAEGQLATVQWLLSEQVNPVPVDRWENRPVDDAMKCGHEDIIKILLDPGAAGYTNPNLDHKEGSSFGVGSVMSKSAMSICGGDWSLGASAAATGHSKKTAIVVQNASIIEEEEEEEEEQ